MRRHDYRIARTILALGLAGATAISWAHEPVAKCYLLNDATVRCRGASNDGDTMPGSLMEVLAMDGTTLVKEALDAHSTLTFRKPAQPFYVLFDTGPGLQVTVEQDEITVPPKGRVPSWILERP